MYPTFIVQAPLGPVSVNRIVSSAYNCDSHRMQDTFPPPSETVRLSLPGDGKLPSFLDMRANTLGMEGYGSTNRIRAFQVTPLECREAIIKSYERYGLSSRPVLTHMLRIPTHHLDRMAGLWATIEDCLLMSSPETYVPERQGAVRRIFDWFVQAYTYGGHTATLKTWKLFCQYVKQKALKAEELQETNPVGFPWYDVRTHTLGVTGITWIDCVVKRGIKSKSEMERLMHLISSRGAPTPSKMTMRAAMIEHQLLRCSKPAEVTPERLLRLYKIGERIARRVDRRALSRSSLRSEHLSVSNSSCMEMPRSKGGRSAYVREALKSWATTVVQADGIMACVLGHKVTLVSGMPLWKCFTPVQPLTPEELDETVAFGDPIKGGTIMQRYAGFNQNLGYLILQWAFLEGIKAQVLTEDHKVIGRFSQKAIALGEPGDKTRCLTVDPAWVTVVLTPFGHILVDTLRTIPEAAAGLGFGDPAFRFSQEIAKQSQDRLKSRIFFEYAWFMTMDLDKATDHFHREKCRYLLRGYLHGLGRDFENPYNLMCIDLLVSERHCVWALDGATHTSRGET